MYTDDDLESALQAGVLTDDNVAAFRAHVAQRHHAVAVDEESFRLVSSFNDIFVVIACAMLLLSLKWIGTTLGQPGLGAAAIATAACCWPNSSSAAAIWHCRRSCCYWPSSPAYSAR